MTTTHDTIPRAVQVDLAMEEAHAFRSLLDDVFLGTGPVYGEDLKSVFEEGGLGPQGSTLRAVMGAFGFQEPVEGWGEHDEANASALRPVLPHMVAPTPKARRVPGSPRPGAPQATSPQGTGTTPHPTLRTGAPTQDDAPSRSEETGFAAVLAQMEAAAQRISYPASAPRVPNTNTGEPATASHGPAPGDAPERYTLVMDADQATRARHLLYAIKGPFQDDSPRPEDPLGMAAAKSIGRAITAAFPDLPAQLRVGNIVVSYQDDRKETYGEGPDGSHGLLSVRQSVQDAATKAMPAHPRPGAGYPKKRRSAQDER